MFSPSSNRATPAFTDGIAPGDGDVAFEPGRGAAAAVARRRLVHQVGRRGGRHGAGTDQGQSGEEGVPEPAEPRRLSPSEPALPQLGHQGRNTVTSWLSLIDR